MAIELHRKLPSLQINEGNYSVEEIQRARREMENTYNVHTLPR